MASRLLSKTRYLNGLQCPKLLWVSVHEPRRLPEPDAATQHVFDQGHLVGELAKRLYPNGMDLPTDNFKENLNLTRRCLEKRIPLFEAGIMAGNLYSRTDILNPADDGAWDIIEVKSATSVKEVHIHDVAFQKYCWESAGITIRNCYLTCINNSYVKHGEIIPAELFISNDISGEVEDYRRDLPESIERLMDVIVSRSCPKSSLGSHCDNPYPCALADECRAGLPEHNVFTLYHGGKKSYELYGDGIINLADIPVDFKLNDKQRIQCACALSGEPYIDHAAIREFMGSLEYPLYYLDFETFSTAVPLFDGTRPYQNIPFQFSLHVQPSASAASEHYEFLAPAGIDPRPGLITALDEYIGPGGSIMAYNKSFEEHVIKELGEAFPEFAPRAQEINSRLVDLIVPFRNFAYYHPAQFGSASLKKVLPAVTGLGYAGLAIGRGDDASLAFLSLITGMTPASDEEMVRKNLLEYCKLDTEGMVYIMKRFAEMTAETIQYSLFPEMELPPKKPRGRKRK